MNRHDNSMIKNKKYFLHSLLNNFCILAAREFNFEVLHPHIQHDGTPGTPFQDVDWNINI